MSYCLYNAIKTPDGTILHCEDNHDYRLYKDKVSGEEYMNDGTGYSIRRSVNEVPYEELSIFVDDPFEKVRTAKFWGSYGKDGNSPKRMMSLDEMEESHLHAIIETQKRIRGTPIEPLFLQEIQYRIANFKKELDGELPTKDSKDSKPKI